MAPPPLITPAHYTNWMPFESQDTPGSLSIACRWTPRGAIALHGGMIAATFCAFGWLTYAKAPEWFWATVALGTLTLASFLTTTIFFHRSQQQRGPVLVYDKKKTTIVLPRESRAFRPDEVDCICLVDGRAAEDPISQLQLHSRSGDRLLLVAGYRGTLDDLAAAIASSVPVPVRRYCEVNSDEQPSEPQTNG